MSKDPQEPFAEDQQPRPNETFLERFHRRKTAARQATEAPQTAPADTTEAALVPQQSEPEAVPDLTDADMPPVESLTADSDYRGFLSPKVSESLRRTALRRLFHGSEFNVIDELDDYAEDFTTFEALGDFLTADMRHQIEVAARKQAAAVKQALRDEEEPVEAVEDQRVVHDDAISSEDVAATSEEMPVSASEPSDDSEQRRHRS